MALPATGRAIFLLILNLKSSMTSRKAGKNIATKPKVNTVGNRRWVKWLVPLLLILVVIALVLSNLPNFSKPKSGPQFQDEGNLNFVNATGQKLEQIDIEIADEDMSRQQGLMWRKTMLEDEGMLFIMDSLEPQAFWMLNTYLPLDIIFVDDKMQIVKIRPNTKPQSLDQVASEVPALYVVEVKAGFCQRHGVKEGDKIQFGKQ